MSISSPTETPLIRLERVSDRPLEMAERFTLLDNASLSLPPGRYAVLGNTLHERKHLIDLLTGLRQPRVGRVTLSREPSWPIGRAGFARGHITGYQVLHFITRQYGLDAEVCATIAEDLMTEPDRLAEKISFWTGPVRYEFGYVLALLPRFDFYVVDGVFPHEKNRFARLWQPLFEARLAQASLILSSPRGNEIKQYCEQALVIEDGKLRIIDNIEEALELYPARPVTKDRDMPEDVSNFDTLDFI